MTPGDVSLLSRSLCMAWSSIDVEGDGLNDGFAASAYLKELS